MMIHVKPYYYYCKLRWVSCLTLRCSCTTAVGRALPAEREVLGIMEGWFGRPDAKFIFQCKLYTDTIIGSKDPKIINMLFIQVRQNAHWQTC